MLPTGRSPFRKPDQTQDIANKFRTAGTVLSSDTPGNILRDEKALCKVMGVDTHLNRREGFALEPLNYAAESGEEVNRARNIIQQPSPATLTVRESSFSPLSHDEIPNINYSVAPYLQIPFDYPQGIQNSAIPGYPNPYNHTIIKKVTSNPQRRVLINSEPLRGVQSASNQFDNYAQNIQNVRQPEVTTGYSAHGLLVPQPTGSSKNHVLQHYQMELMLLERQNKKRLLMAQQEQDAMDELRKEDVEKQQNSSSQTTDLNKQVEVPGLSTIEEADGYNSDATEPQVEQHSMKHPHVRTKTPFKYTISEDLTVNDEIRHQAQFVALQGPTKPRFMLSEHRLP